MPTTVYAPKPPATALSRSVIAPSGTIYWLNGAGNCVSADVDTPWFLSQGFSAQPAAAVYAPFEGRGMARQVTNPNTGNTFTFNSSGFATGITGADLTWFKNQGFVTVPAGTVLAKAPGGSRLASFMTNPSTGNSYQVNDRGFVVAVGASDIGWFYSQGFSPVAAGTLLAADAEITEAPPEQPAPAEPPPAPPAPKTKSKGTLW